MNDESFTYHEGESLCKEPRTVRISVEFHGCYLGMDVEPSVAVSPSASVVIVNQLKHALVALVTEQMLLAQRSPEDVMSARKEAFAVAVTLS